jgi:anthranilate synthase component I
MTFEQFEKLSQEHSIVPVYQFVTADLLTPVLAYMKIREENSYSFLLESVEGIGRLARYSFIAKKPSKIISNIGKEITITKDGQAETFTGDIFDYLQKEISAYNTAKLPELPVFTGGVVGYLGFENVGLIEPVIEFTNPDEIDLPDSMFGVYETLLAFDHYKHRMIIITNVHIDKEIGLQKQYYEALSKIRRIKRELSLDKSYETKFTVKNSDISLPTEDTNFCDMVEKSKVNILEGDIFQIVPSKRFRAEFEGDLLNVYRALRIINPSPYMYFIELNDDFKIIGTSPEDLLKVSDGTATILPIAGTRKRGRTEEEDLEMEKDMLNDPKEIAEHVMLVDLARNDLGRVCEFDSVRVSSDKVVQRYSHVMHIVSRVEGKLTGDKDCIDALKASFPAGTLTGAPKIRAIQLINDYEKVQRKVYGGAVGYIDYNGNLDMCIAIRTFFAKGNTIYWQAGAGVVADSIPRLELKEVNNKSAVLVSALKYAEEINESFSN